MRRPLISVVILCVSGLLIGQTPVFDFNLSLRGDSIRLVEEYYPAINLSDPARLDLSMVDAACAQYLNVNERGNLLSLYQEGQLSSAYRVDKQGMRIEYEPELEKMFGEYGDVTMTNISNNYLLDFPIENIETKKNQEHAFEIMINNPDSKFGDYDHLTVQVYVTQSIESFERLQVTYPYGQRLTIPVLVENDYVVGEVHGYKKGDKVTIDTDIFESRIPKDPIQYYYLLNHHKGALLAEIRAMNGEAQSVKLFEEVTERSFLPECINDQESFQLYPNPSYGIINLMLNDPGYGEYRIEVFSVIGKLLYSEDLPHYQDVTKYKVTLPNLPKGTYLYSILDADDRRLYTRRLTIVDF